MEQLNDLTVFIAVAEQKGFSAASKLLGITTAGVSKSIKRLEYRLGVRLFTRTTRKIFLTKEGEIYYQRTKPILDAAQEAENEIVDQSRSVEGKVTLLLPVLFGQHYVIPILAKFKHLYPKLQLDIRLSDERVNLLEAGADLAIRIGPQQDSSLRARKISETRFVTCASPAYFQTIPHPVTPDALHEHICIAYVVKTKGTIYPWTFSLQNEIKQLDLSFAMSVDDGGANKQLALSGCGIIHDLSLNLQKELESGELIEVLGEFSAIGPPIYLVYPDGKYLPKRTRALIDFLFEHLHQAD